MKTFTDKVLEIVRKIPRGHVMTYTQIAKLAGSPKAVRAVGNATMKNKNLKIPCHRVVKSDGSVGKYNGLRNKQFGRNGKVALLKKEGVRFSGNYKVIIS